MHSLNNAVVIMNKLFPLLFCIFVGHLQTNVYISVLQTVQVVFTYFQCKCNIFGKGQCSGLFAMFSLI